MRTRIIHLTKYMPEFPGGIERATHTMAVAGQAAGARVTIIGATPRPEERIVTGESVDTIALPIAFKIANVPIVPGFFKIGALLDEADLVHIHLPNPSAELALLWYLARRPHQRPKIVPVVHAPMMRFPHLAEVWERLFHRNLLRHSDGVIFPSPQLAEYLRSYQRAIGRKPVHILPFGIPAPPKLTPDPYSPRHGGPVRLLAIGRLVPYKGFDTLIRAVSHIRQEWALTIAGQGPEEESLKSLIDGLGLTSRIQLIERIPEAEKHALLSRCDILIMPSQTAAESFGLVMGEAFAHGKAVITTDLNTGVAFLARGGKCGAVVPVRSPGRLADAIERLIQNEDQRIEAGKANLDFWKQELAPETFQRRYAELVARTTAPSLLKAS